MKKVIADPRDWWDLDDTDEGNSLFSMLRKIVESMIKFWAWYPDSGLSGWFFSNLIMKGGVSMHTFITVLTVVGTICCAVARILGIFFWWSVYPISICVSETWRLTQVLIVFVRSSSHKIKPHIFWIDDKFRVYVVFLFFRSSYGVEVFWIWLSYT